MMASRHSFLVTVVASMALVLPSAVLASDDVAGTKWAVHNGEAGDIEHVEFKADHTLTAVFMCVPVSKCPITHDEGTWTQDAASINWDTSDKNNLYTGTINGDRMSGTAKNRTDNWNWTAERER